MEKAPSDQSWLQRDTISAISDWQSIPKLTEGMQTVAFSFESSTMSLCFRSGSGHCLQVAWKWLDTVFPQRDSTQGIFSFHVLCSPGFWQRCFYARSCGSEQENVGAGLLRSWNLKNLKNLKKTEDPVSASHSRNGFAWVRKGPRVGRGWGSTAGKAVLQPHCRLEIQSDCGADIKTPPEYSCSPWWGSVGAWSANVELILSPMCGKHPVALINIKIPAHTLHTQKD